MEAKNYDKDLSEEDFDGNDVDVLSGSCRLFLFLGFR